MALIVVNLTDTFEDWRTKTNSSISQVGDLTILATTNQSSIVAAINESLQNVVEDVAPELGGDLDVLTRSIVSSSNRNITITPHGTGNVVITKGDYTGSLNTATTAVTQTAGNNTTLLATTAFVTAAVASEDQLSEMNDVTISSPANLEILQYTGSVWENKTASAAGLPTRGFTIAMAVALG